MWCVGYFIYFCFCVNVFLYYMVCNLMGCFVVVGCGCYLVDWFVDVLVGCDCNFVVFMFMVDGLYFVYVGYLVEFVVLFV